MDPLPAGWAEHTDPGSGNKFFYNAGTGETTWERPKNTAAATTALPEGWTEHLDAGSGKNFYYNASTGQTTWERPQAAPTAAPPANSLPKEWAEHLDPGSGRTFYYNATTGETTWERPQGASSGGGGGAFAQTLQGICQFLDEVKAAQTEFTRSEDSAVAAVLAMHESTLKAHAAQSFAQVSAIANQLLPQVRAVPAMPLSQDLLSQLNTAVQACELRYGMRKTDTIPINLLNAQPDGKLWPNLVKKVEGLCGRQILDLEKRESDAFKHQLLNGGCDANLDAQRAAFEANLKQTKQSLWQKYAQILAPSDHLPVIKTVPAGARSLSVMTWNVMEFPQVAQVSGRVLDGLVPMVDLIVKNTQRKEERYCLLDAMSSDEVIAEHLNQMVAKISDSFETKGVDIILLQEVGKDAQAQIHQACHQKGWHCCFSTGIEEVNKCNAITAIVSKIHFDEQTQIEVQEARKVRHFAAVRLGTAWVVSCHIPLGSQTTEEQKQDVGARMVQEISQRFFRYGSGIMLIVGGDWNSDVNGVKNRLSMNMPYGISQLQVHTDAKTAYGADFPVDGILSLQ